MILILTIRNADALQEGVAAQYMMDGPNAVIGRSRNCNWYLPDPRNAISSRHCEIRREGDAFLLKDISTNGTFVNDAPERITERPITAGDLIRIGQYEVVVSVEGEVLPEPEPVTPENEITFHPSGPIPDAAPAAAETPAAEAPHAPVPDNVTVMWDSLADINAIDRERGLFGVKDAEAAPVTGGDAATVDRLVAAMLDAAAVAEGSVERSPELLQKAGSLLKRLVAGLLVMVEARARAKAQMGAEMTGLQLEGNNPIKFARSPEQALAQLLMPPQDGFMDADKAVEDAYLDLQSHQVATLRAIPGALRSTLDRFSPGSIRRRAENIGLLARILPGARDAALWRNYEREFVAVKKESDEAFMEVFSKEFRKAYERQLRDGLS
ncbi:MAG TPA: type VI secretion system-associated FHA domain protein TagH [Allosphingosinicella sp.]|jgi:predicted component of type VI protein secretion system|nr:type VI secretion system-associated FHA domain protein TagH [Allosphingosinicella sp.]